MTDDAMPRDNSSAAEVARLRECLQALSATSGKTIVRVELETTATQIMIRVTAPSERTEDDIGRLVIAYLANCGFVKRRTKKAGRRG